MSEANIQKVYHVFFKPGEVVELRALGVGGKNRLWDNQFARQDQGVFGYFDNAEDFARAAWQLDQLHEPPHGIYFTINPPQPAVMARANNRLVAVNKKRPCTSDKEIRCVRWLPVDLDVSKSVRPAGVSSSQEELDQAMEAGRQLREFLTGLGFPDPVKGMSGNGYHLNYRIPEMDPEEGKALIKKCLAALQDHLAVEHVDVDQKVFNPSRIWKIYGTTARKGDSIPGRPHRVSFLFKNTVDTFDQVQEVPLAKLQALADLAPKEEKKAAGLPAVAKPKKPPAAGRTKKMHTNSLGKVQLDKYLAAFGINYQAEQRDGATWYYLVDGCLFDTNHKGKDAAIIQNADGKITYTCFHDSCTGYTWPDVRQVVSGQEKIAEYCENYDPNWTPSRTCGLGLLEGVEVLRAGEPEPGSLLITFVNAPDTVPPPEEIEAQEFFQYRGKREKFCVQKMASYLAIYLAPIVCTAGKLYRYKSGVWSEYEDGAVAQLVAVALKDRVQVNWMKEALALLKAIVRRGDDHWLPYEGLVNLRNGMVDMTDGSLLPHDPKYCSRIQLPIDFDPGAFANRWVQFLKEIFPEKGDDGHWASGGGMKVMMLQEFMGYCLMNTCKYEKCLFMYGQGANGKSTVLNVMEKMLGAEHCGDMEMDDLSNRFNLPYLQNLMINKSAEAMTKEQSSIQKLKSFISGDRITGEWKYGEQVNFTPRTKFLFAMNLPPNIHDKSHGFDRKVLVLNFNRVFDESEMDRDLLNRLVEELNGIFIFALEGAMRLREQNYFTSADIIEQEKGMFMGQLNNVLSFVGECCDLDAKYRIGTDEMFEAYKIWCDKNGLRALGAPKFHEQLMHKWNIPKIKARNLDGTRKMMFVGIQLSSMEIGGISNETTGESKTDGE